MNCGCCGQPLLNKPTRCWRCKRAFDFDEQPAWVRERGVCTPIHASCVDFQPSVEPVQHNQIATDAGSETNRPALPDRLL